MRFRKANAADLSNDLSQLLDDLKEVLTTKGRDTDPAASLLLSKAASTLEKVKAASSNAISESKAKIEKQAKINRNIGFATLALLVLLVILHFIA